MKILFVGEIVADAGRRTVKEILPSLIEEIKPDFVFANAENMSGGRGATQANLEEMRKLGIDYFTSGDHIFWQKETEPIIENLPVIIPANYPKGTPGVGYKLIDGGPRGNVLLINLMGRTGFSSLPSFLDDPFRKFDKIMAEFEGQKIDAVVVDFHGDATSEKISFAYYVDGRATAVVGSHTHVPTCDGIDLPKGTLFITDVGMIGAIDSVLGVQKDIVVNQFLTARNQKFVWEESGRRAFRSVLIDTDSKSITRIDRNI